MTHKAKTWWTFAITSAALFMVTLDNLVVTTAIPVIRQDLHAGLSGLEWTVNAYTLVFAVFLLTGAALGDRFGRRLMFSIGIGDLHGCLRGCRARSVDRRARCRARRAGARRRDRAAADADHPLGRRPGGAPRRLPRRVGRHQRSRGRLRAARRRCRRERHLLALDLLAQRSARPRASAARLAAARRDEGPVRARRPARRRARQCGALRDRLGARARQLGRLGHARDPRSVRSRLRVRRGVRRVGAARRAPDAADALLPQPHVRAGECRVDADELRDVRLGVPARAVLPDRAGLLAARLRPAHPPVDCDADDRRPDRGRALGPHLSVADHRHGARPAGRSAWRGSPRCRRPLRRTST